MEWVERLAQEKAALLVVSAVEGTALARPQALAYLGYALNVQRREPASESYRCRDGRSL